MVEMKRQTDRDGVCTCIGDRVLEKERECTKTKTTERNDTRKTNTTTRQRQYDSRRRQRETHTDCLNALFCHHKRITLSVYPHPSVECLCGVSIFSLLTHTYRLSARGRHMSCSLSLLSICLSSISVSMSGVRLPGHVVALSCADKTDRPRYKGCSPLSTTW